MDRKLEHWLVGWEIDRIVDTLLKYDVEIISIDESSGDLSMQLENARQHPEAIGYLTGIYKNALTRLQPDLLIEANASVSTIVPLLAAEMKIPYLKFNPAKGELDHEIRGRSIVNKRAAIIVDIVDQAESLLPLYRACRQRRLQIMPAITLVDMGHRWRRDFERFEMDLDVWSGMDIDDIRMTLIEQGHLEGHPAEVDEPSPLVISLEGKKWDRAMEMARHLRPAGCLFKISDQLVEYGCNEAIRRLGAYGPVVADLNIAHTPEVTGDICTRLRAYSPWAVTVNGFAGEKVARIAVKTLRPAGVKVLVNTILPTLDKADLGLLHGSPQPDRLIERIGEIAKAADADGVICAPDYVLALRKRYPEMRLIAANEQGVGNAMTDMGENRQGRAAEVLRQGANHVAVDMSELESGNALERAIALSEEYLAIRQGAEKPSDKPVHGMRNVMRLEKKSG